MNAREKEYFDLATEKDFAKFIINNKHKNLKFSEVERMPEFRFLTDEEKQILRNLYDSLPCAEEYPF